MAHKSYEDYTIEDFITDASFIDWVMNPESLHQHFWESWESQHPERSKDIQAARQFIRGIGFETHRLPAAAVAHDYRKLNYAIQQTPPVKQPPVFMMHPRIWSRVAAVFIGLLTLAFAYYYVTQEPQMLEYTTAYGETKTIILPDRSVVTLNANSTIQYLVGWEERKVWLQGEAFFEVKKIMLYDGMEEVNENKRRLSDQEQLAPEKVKFVVHTEDVMVEVLGTKFNVHHRRGKTAVVLNSGKVKLTANTRQDTGIEMLPGDYAAFSEEQHTFERKQVHAEDYSAWKKNQLVFRNAAFTEIATVLGDNYGLQTEFRNPDIAHYRYTGTTPADNLNELFTKLSLLFQVKVTQVSNQIIIEKQ